MSTSELSERVVDVEASDSSESDSLQSPALASTILCKASGDVHFRRSAGSFRRRNAPGRQLSSDSKAWIAMDHMELSFWDCCSSVKVYCSLV